MRKLTLSIAAATLATAGAAFAAPGMMAMPDMTRAQVEAKTAERFAKMDVNGDGVLNAADREAHRTAMRGKVFDKLDADNNGSISEAEFAARHAARGEGQHAGHEGMKAGKRMGMRGHRMGARHMGGRMAMAKMADTNNDNAISRAEFTAAALSHFDKADADNNGTVTQAERQAARAAMRAQWQAKRQAAKPAN